MTTVTLTHHSGYPEFFGDILKAGGCISSFSMMMSSMPVVFPTMPGQQTIPCMSPAPLNLLPKHLQGGTRHRVANAHQLYNPSDSANCLGWSTCTVFLRPAESRKLCLCVFIGFLGYGTRDGWCGNRGERVPDQGMNQSRQL